MDGTGEGKVSRHTKVINIPRKIDRMQNWKIFQRFVFMLTFTREYDNLKIIQNCSPFDVQ